MTTLSESQLPGPPTNNQGAPPYLQLGGPGILNRQPGGPGPLTENQEAHNWRPGGPRAPNLKPRDP